MIPNFWKFRWPKLITQCEKIAAYTKIIKLYRQPTDKAKNIQQKKYCSFLIKKKPNEKKNNDHGKSLELILSNNSKEFDRQRMINIFSLFSKKNSSNEK